MSLIAEELSKVIGGAIKQTMVAKTSSLAATLSNLKVEEVPRSETDSTVLRPFDEGNETFAKFLGRLEKHLKGKNLDNATPEGDRKCVKILINSLPAEVHRELKYLTAPEKPKSRKFEELCDLLKAHLDCPSDVAERRFSARLQQPGETVAEYVAELERLASSCDFSCDSCKKSTLDFHVKSQLVRGLRDMTIRERLSTEAEKSLDEVTQLAVSLEQSQIESGSTEKSAQGKSDDLEIVKYDRPCPYCGGDCPQDEDDSSPEEEKALKMTNKLAETLTRKIKAFSNRPTSKNPHP